MSKDSLSKAILRSHPTAIVAIDRMRRVCYANYAAVRLLATGEEAVEGQDVVDLFGGDERLAFAIDSACCDSEERRINLAFWSGESQIEVGLTLSPTIEEAPPLSMILSFRDIKERKLLDDRVGQLERLASAERLVGGFAHQLRNPLAALSALVENLVAETPTSDPRVEYTSRLLNQVERIERLIRACLELGLDPSVMRRQSPSESIGRAAIESFDARRGVACRLVVEPGTGDVVVCEKQIAKCLRLLLENALDACGDVTKMKLLVSSEAVGGANRFVRFVVHDEGPGIEKGNLGKLFEPFFTTRAKGVGIGLAAAQALAVNNGGAIEVRSEPGDTQFILRLRAAKRASC